jgi:hypothetical protein
MPWFLTATKPTVSYAVPSDFTKEAFLAGSPLKKSAKSTTGIDINM